VYAQDFVSLFIHKEFDESIVVEYGNCTAVSFEWKYAFFVLDTIRFKLLFSFSNTSYFRLGVYNAWNNILVNMTVTGCNKVYRSNTVFLRLMCEHRPFNAVPDCINIVNISFQK